MVKQLNLEEFDALLASGEEFLLEAGAFSWCKPCHALLPRLEQLASEVSYQVVKMDVEEVPELTKRYGIKGVPALFHFKEGKVHKQTVGAVSLDKLKDLAK